MKKRIVVIVIYLGLVSCAGFSELSKNAAPKHKLNTINYFTSPWTQKQFGATIFNYWNDAKWVYFLFEVDDENLTLAKHKKSEEQNVLYSDRVELFFTKDSLLQPYYTLEMDANGRLFDAKCTKGEKPKIDETWDWPKDAIEIKSQLTKTGYTLEGKISIKSLNEFELIHEDRLLCGVMRANFLNNKEVQWITWQDPKTLKPDFHNWGVFGVLEID